MAIQSDTEYGLIDLFNKYFKVVPADSPEDRLKCYRLRYRVYYEEGLFPGMNPDDCPRQMEKDEYDDRRSKHCLLIYKPRDIIAGTVRLILPDTDNLDARFPLETVAGDLFFRDIISDENIPRSCVGEISRLILAPEFRARKGENQHPYGSHNHMENYFDTSQNNNFNQSKKIQRRKFPHAILGLFVGVARLSFENNVTYWYSNMDPAWARILKSFGINFTPITPVMDFHGPRQGYFASSTEIAVNVYRSNPQIWALLTNNGLYCPLRKHPSSEVPFSITNLKLI